MKLHPSTNDLNDLCVTGHCFDSLVRHNENTIGEKAKGGLYRIPLSSILLLGALVMTVTYSRYLILDSLSIEVKWQIT